MEDVHAGTLVDLALPTADGGVVDFARLRGRVVVVHFASTNSLTSQIDLRELRTVAGNRDAIMLVEVAADPNEAKLAGPWARAAGIGWPVALATPDLIAGHTAFGLVPVVPTTFVIDRDGKLAWRAIGPLPRGELAKVVQPLAR
jgi:hypothetical protein